MATTAITENKAKPADNVARALLAQWGDYISKLWIPLLAFIYAIGFITVSIYRSSLGLNAANPLRPQVIGAGVLFCGSLILAFVTKEWAFDSVRHLCNHDWVPGKAEVFKLSFGSLYLWLYDSVTAWSVQLLFDFNGRQKWPRLEPVTVVVIWVILSIILTVPDGSQHPLAKVARVCRDKLGHGVT